MGIIRLNAENDTLMNKCEFWDRLFFCHFLLRISEYEVKLLIKNLSKTKDIVFLQAKTTTP